eukprot:scaffold6273_cov136-Skeletonema_marinoi.AAC.4
MMGVVGVGKSRGGHWVPVIDNWKVIRSVHCVRVSRVARRLHLATFTHNPHIDVWVLCGFANDEWAVVLGL